MGRTTNMSVCMSNSFPSDIGTLIGLILACFGKKKKREGKGKRAKETFPLCHIIRTNLRNRFKAIVLTTFLNKHSGDIFILMNNK